LEFEVSLNVGAWNLELSLRGGCLVLSRVQQMLKTSSGNFNSSFITAGVLLLIGAALALLIKPPQTNR
jgi:hypothetical protein